MPGGFRGRPGGRRAGDRLLPPPLRDHPSSRVLHLRPVHLGTRSPGLADLPESSKPSEANRMNMSERPTCPACNRPSAKWGDGVAQPIGTFEIWVCRGQDYEFQNDAGEWEPRPA